MRFFVLDESPYELAPNMETEAMNTIHISKSMHACVRTGTNVSAVLADGTRLRVCQVD